MDNFTKIILPDEVDYIVKTLNKEGHRAYVVGGCVRDSIIGKNPNDWDIATDASPNIVKHIFKKTVDTGIKHGTITVVLDKKNIEVTTFRREGSYSDFRRPDHVVFSNSLSQDLSRRDFTINAMAYHPTEALIDPFGGIDDIRNKTIKCVGEPIIRFSEDPLRMLRAVRFSSQLNFKIEDSTYDSIKKTSYLIEKISEERIRDELTKILISDNPQVFYELKTLELLKFIIPEFLAAFETPQNHPHHVYDVGTHSLHSVKHIEKSMHLRWTMLLHDIGKTLTRTTDQKGVDHFYNHSKESVRLAKIILMRLKFDNKNIDMITRLIDYHDRPINPNEKSVRRVLNLLGRYTFQDLLKVKAADCKSQNPFFIDSKLDGIIKINEIFESVIERNECFSLKNLAINGDDLIGLGYNQGKEIGIILHKLLEKVISNPNLNTKDSLLNIVHKKQ